MELWQFYRIIRRRKMLILIGTLICIGIVVVSTRLGTDRYVASTTIMEKMSSDDRVMIYAGAYGYQSDPRTRLANLAQLVKSRTVMERAAATLSEMKQVGDPQAVLRTTDVIPVLDTEILRITVRSESEEEAKTAADIIAKEFIAYYNEMNYGGAVRSKQFIEAETPRAQARLNAIRGQLRKFKEQSGMVRLDQQTGLLLQQINLLDVRAAESQILADQARARLESIKSRLKDFPETRTMGRVMATNPMWQSLQSDVIRQQIELERMLRKRTEEHPEVQTLRRQLTETKRQLADQMQTIVNTVSESVNPIRDNLVQNYLNAAVEESAGRASFTATKQEIASLKPQLASLPADDMRLAQLTMEEDAARNTYSLLRQKLDEAMIKVKEAEDMSSIRVVDPARTEPAQTQKQLKVILAIVLSPIFCAGVALLLDYLDNSVKTPEEAEVLLKLPVFAVVPIARSHSLLDKKCLPVIDTSFQMLSTNLWFGNSEMVGNTVLVASAEPDVGRSTTAANLAITLARDGAKVILVDGDLRQPAQQDVFGLDNEIGLSNILAGKLALKDALKPTSVTDLLVLTSGPLPANPMRLFRSPRMQKFVEEISRLADYVVFDSPAGISFADSMLLAGLVKNVVIVYAAGTVPRGAEIEFIKKLDLVNANTLGTVLNMVNPEDSHGFYHMRIGYEEMLRSGKGSAAVAERMFKAIPVDTGEEAEEKSDRE